MKNIFLINPHSFIDVITNSSTELFVCSGNKTLEMVEELISNIGWCEARKPNEEELLIVKYKDELRSDGCYSEKLYRNSIKDKKDLKIFDRHWYWPKEGEKYLYCSYWYQKQMTKDTIIIEWTEDNSISREWQELLENYGFNRYHLG